ncbi:MAG: MupG family TIM beta-alpha barrel fold protein [Erysipelotrichales bacterium]|nr:MupG family TIM beta-alpha barrel fold protein [Erysipelotrichales bacterium]
MRLGASLYLGLEKYTIGDNLAFLKLCQEEGIEYIFTSMHMPEANESLVSDFEAIKKFAKELDIKLIVDISQPTKLNLAFLNDIYAVRLDYGFTDQDIIEIAKNYSCKIELNASTLTEEKLENLLFLGLDLNRIRASHNFYPKNYTGLNYEQVKNINRHLNKMKISVMAYIPCASKRPPIFEGLPTIEAHRRLSIGQAISELKFLGCDEVFFGDALATKEEIRLAKSFCGDKILIPITIKKDICAKTRKILKGEHRFRFDESDYLRRSLVFKGSDIKPFNTIERKPGAIVIDNNLYERYRGEVSIIKQKLPQDKKVNVIGFIDSEFLWRNIESETTFNFLIIGEEE